MFTVIGSLFCGVGDVGTLGALVFFIGLAGIIVALKDARL